MRLQQHINEATELQAIIKVAKVVGVVKFRKGIFQLFTHAASKQAAALAVLLIIQKTWPIYVDSKYYPLTKKAIAKIVAHAWHFSGKKKK